MAIFVALIASGCASTESVKETKGEGVSRTYAYAYEPVYNSVLAAAKTKNLKVVENDKSNGRLILSHGVTLWSWGERIAIFVKPISSASTEVEIVSKPVLEPLNFPPDWQKILFEQVDVELRTQKLDAQPSAPARHPEGAHRGIAGFAPSALAG
ncbi:hypothetical protein [Burkholderia sp. BCC1977]|uniref:hypothetical protein n=1 Tax=Burkholderia sp. BCC1977 TaxID=2817440 RepID=UPI002ABE2724|nr:hypothetical protein [Burkholderia sp. BCC1977]